MSIEYRCDRDYEVGHTFCITCSIGHSGLVELLLRNGASTSVLCPSGDLYNCLCSMSIQKMLDDHHRNHTKQIFDAVADKRSGLKKLRNIFLVGSYCCGCAEILAII